LETGKVAKTYFEGANWDGITVAIAPDGRRAAAWMRSGGLKLFDLDQANASPALTAGITSPHDAYPPPLPSPPAPPLPPPLPPPVDGNVGLALCDPDTGMPFRVAHRPGALNRLPSAAAAPPPPSPTANGTVSLSRLAGAPPQPLSAEQARDKQQAAARALG